MDDKLTYNQRKKIAMEFIEEIHEYHRQMLNISIENNAKTTHKIANRNLLEAYKWIGRGKTTPWSKQCYKEEID